MGGWAVSKEEPDTSPSQGPQRIRGIVSQSGQALHRGGRIWSAVAGCMARNTRRSSPSIAQIRGAYCQMLQKLWSSVGIYCGGDLDALLRAINLLYPNLKFSHLAKHSDSLKKSRIGEEKDGI